MSKTVQYTADLYDKDGMRAEVFIDWNDDGSLKGFWVDIYDDENQKAWTAPYCPADECEDSANAY